MFMAVTYLWNTQKLIKTDSITIEIVEPTQVKPVASTSEKLKAIKKKLEKLEKQIVEQEEKSRNEEVTDTRFLSAKNQKVEKQTVTKNRGEFQNSKKNGKNPSKEPGKKFSFSEMNPKLGKFKTYDPTAMKDDQASAEKNQSAGGDQASATSDYIKDVDQGLETLLNAREFKYYTYYNRIRRQLTQHWEGNVRMKLSQMFKQGRYLASATDRVTKLVVILDKKGNLVKVQMLKDSGVTDLDDAAIEAFQSAAPFPNPPQGIIESDGTVKIRWDFVLET